MAITLTSLTSGADGTARSAGDNYITASITPTANRLVLAFIHNDGDQDDAPTLTGNSLTWVQIGYVRFNTIAVNSNGLSIHRAMGTPTTGTIAVASTTHQAGCIWSIFELAGVDTSGTNGSGAVVQVVTDRIDASTSMTVTLAAFGSADNATVGGFGIDRNPTADMTPGTGFTEIHEIGHGAPTRGLHTIWRADNDTTVDSSQDQVRDWGAVALEIKAAVEGQPAFKRWGHTPFAGRVLPGIGIRGG